MTHISTPLQATVALARRLGIHCDSPTILRDSNNTIVHLPPAPVIAKVATSVTSRKDDSSLARELAIALFAMEQGLGVVPPSDLVPVCVHKQDTYSITFWKYIPHTNQRFSREPGWFGTEVRKLHDALADYSGPLPDAFAGFAAARTLLENRTGGIAMLNDQDVQLLLDKHAHYMGCAISMSDEKRVVHGDCRPENFFEIAGGVMWYDFEAACRSPRELDCFAMDQESLKSYGPVNQQLLDVIRKLQSICVAIWCNAQRGRSPQVDEAAEHHLELARKRLNYRE